MMPLLALGVGVAFVVGSALVEASLGFGAWPSRGRGETRPEGSVAAIGRCGMTYREAITLWGGTAFGATVLG